MRLHEIAVSKGAVLWRPKPKLHYFMEMLDDYEHHGWSGCLNPSKLACWLNEDMMGKMARIGRKTHASTVSRRIVERFALAARLDAESVGEVQRWGGLGGPSTTTQLRTST